MKIDTKSSEFHSLTVSLIARTVAFCVVNNTWSVEEKIDGAMNNFSTWFGSEIEKLKKKEKKWWKKTLDKMYWGKVS